MQEILARFAANDNRIRFVARSTNGGIAAATNAAIAIAAGDFVALLDHDDILHETALYEVAAEIARTSFSDARSQTCILAARRAITDHLARNGVDARVEVNQLHPTWSRVIYPLPHDPPQVVILIPLAASDRGVTRAINDLRERTDYSELRFVVIANDEIDEACERDLAMLRGRTDVRVIRRRGILSPLAAIRIGVDAVKDEEIVVFADTSTAIRSSALWLEELVSQIARREVAAAGPALRFASGHLGDAGGAAVFGGEEEIDPRTPGYFGLFCFAREVATLGATGFAVRRSALTKAGGLDPAMPSLDAAVTDLCGRLFKAVIAGRPASNTWLTPF